MIKEKLKSLLNIILYGYNLLVYWLIRIDDKQKRQAQHKRENADYGSFTLKIQRLWLLIMYYLTPKKFSLSEQKDLVEMLRMSIKFRNPIQQPFEYMMSRSDLRLFVRLQCKRVYEELTINPLHECLSGKKMLDDEYVELIRIAKETGEYYQTYCTIIDSITEKQKRRTTLMLLLLQPIFTLLIGIGSEIFVALYLIPMVIVNIDVESLTGTVLSYYNLREIILNHKTEYGIKLLLVGILVFLFLKLPATKYLIDICLVQIPVINKYIARWEISKFFGAMNDMIRARASLQVATKTALGLVSNMAIRYSLEKDLQEKGSKTNDLGVILSDSIYIDLKIRNQLKVTANSGGNTTELLDSIVEEYKDSIKKLMEAPNQLIIPIMLVFAGIYIFTRLIPLFTELSTLMQNIN